MSVSIHIKHHDNIKQKILFMKHILYFIKPIPETKLCPESYLDNIFDKKNCAELIHTTYEKKENCWRDF
jgi:hypothetical protein